MCGIAGIVAAEALHPDDRERVVSHARRHRASWTRRCGVLRRRARGARPSPAEHRRSGRRPPATLERGRLRSGLCSTGRSTTTSDVRARLESAGHRYRRAPIPRRSCTPTSSGGRQSVEHLRGMFAFAIWDAPRRRLLLARDRLGVKPLYWAKAGDRLLFGSEIKSILDSGLIRRATPTSSLSRSCSARDISRAPKPCSRGFIVCSPATRSSSRTGYDLHPRVLGYSGRDTRQPEIGDHSRTPRSSRRFRELLEESVRIRLMADVPLGMFLSGGLDSSAIAALMSRMIDRPLQTFSVAFKQRAFSELDYARQVAHGDQRRRPRDRHRRPGLLRGAAAADLARG